MGSVLVVLDPGELANPDLDLRLLLADLLERRSGGALADNGWGYAEGGSDIHLFLCCEDPCSAVPMIEQALGSERLLGNDLSKLVVAIAPSEEAEHSIVLPRGRKGTVSPAE